EYVGLNPARVEDGEPRRFEEFQRLWSSPGSMPVSLIAAVGTRLLTFPAVALAARRTLVAVQAWREDHFRGDWPEENPDFDTEYVSIVEGRIAAGVRALALATGDRSRKTMAVLQVAERFVTGAAAPEHAWELLERMFEWCSGAAATLKSREPELWNELASLY